MKMFVLKPPGFMKLSHYSEMRNDALMHREGLKGEEYTCTAPVMKGLGCAGIERP